MLDFYSIGVVYGVMGFIFGSFASMLTYRIPKVIYGEQGWFSNYGTKRSACPECGAQIKWYMLVPILSWAFSKGKCSSCKAPISVRYPLIEGFTAALFIFNYLIFGLSVQSVLILIASFMLLMIVVTDLEEFLIPDALSLPLIPMGIVFSFTGVTDVSIFQSLLGGFIGFFSLWSIFKLHQMIRKEEGMGQGDFKLFAAIGTLVGATGLINVFFIMSMGFLAVIVVMAFFKSLKRNYPLGPFMAIPTVFILHGCGNVLM